MLLAEVVAVAPTPRFKCHKSSPRSAKLSRNIDFWQNTNEGFDTKCLNSKSDVLHPKDLAYAVTFTFASNILFLKSAFIINGKVMKIFTFFVTLGGICLFFVCGKTFICYFIYLSLFNSP